MFTSMMYLTSLYFSYLLFLCYCCFTVTNHIQLFATPWTAAHQAPLSMGFSRILEWVAMPSSRGSSQPRD